jgi:nuclear pore complex protein Nup93
MFGGALGASQNQNAQPKPATGGLFGTSTSQPAASQPAQPPAPLGPLTAQPRQNTGSGTQSAYFDHLLERGKKRNKQQDEDSQFNELPPLQLGLGDIARKVRILGTEGTQTQDSRMGDTRAHYLLAASGVSTAAALRDLKSFSAQTGAGAVSSSAGALDTDVEGYLSNLHAQSTLALISEGLEQSKRDFDSFLEDNVQMEWDSQRRRIYEHFGLAKPAESQDAGASFGQTSSPAARSSFGRSTRKSRLGASASSANGMSFVASGLNRSVIGSGSVKGSGRPAGFSDVTDSAGVKGYSVNDRYQRDKQEKYADKIKQLNLSRLREAPYPLLANLADVEKESGSEVSLTHSHSQPQR